MTVKRVMGTETEYAVSLNTPDRYNPVQLSFDVVNGAADSHSKSIRWDYRQEDPVNDARGTRLERAAARPDMLTDAPQLNITNVIAPNGGRVYVDHAHPEYSAPETTDPFEAVRYDHAGDLIMQAATEHARKQTGTPIALHRNNVDGKGSCWGTHENYMMARAVPFDLVTRLMTLHFVTRQIYAGSGRVGIGENSEIPGYQLSQRADYIHAKVGLQTTFERPIINTRDESHSTDAYRRLHVIVGDANRMEVPQALKLGTTSMLLWLLEHADEAGFDLNAFLDELELSDPVEAIHTVSRDLTLGAILPLANGGETNAWLIQLKLRQAVYQVAALVEGTDTAGEPAWPDKSTTSIMAMWQQALIDCASIRHAADDDERLAMTGEASRIEWLLKWQLLEKLRRKITTTSAPGVANGWNDPRLKVIDLKWAALDPADSIFTKLEPRTERVVSAADIARATTEPPEDTRAWLRAKLVAQFGDEVAAASWSRLTVRDPRAADEGEAVEFYGNAGHMAATRPSPVLPRHLRSARLHQGALRNRTQFSRTRHRSAEVAGHQRRTIDLVAMEETREETPQDLRNLALKVAGLLEEAGQHALHDQLNPRNLAQPSTENADRGPRYKLEVDNKIMRFMSARIADIAHFDGFWTTRPAESRPGQRYWYIGKIDGVINYVRRMSEWTVTAALFEFGPDNEPKPIIGIVHAPALGLTYLAARGAGAVRIHKTAVGEKRDKVVPSMTSSLDGSVLSYGMSFIPSESQRALDVASSLAGRPADIKRVGPVSLDLCKVADGTYDAYFEPMLHVWDIAGIAAGTVVVWEAQGTLSRWDGERIHWRHDNDVVASNGLIIRELQHYLQQYPWLDSINQR